MPPTQIRKRWLVSSVAIFVVAYIAAGVAMWTDRFHGLIANLFMIPVAALMWLMLIFPLHLLMHWLTRSRGSLSQRKIAFFAPLIVLLILIGVGSLPQMSQNRRFTKLAKAPLPDSAQSLKAYHCGGGFADHSDVFYFECSREETMELIEAIGASPSTSLYHTYETPPRGYFGMYQKAEGWPEGWPNPSLWPDLKAYKQDDGHWFRTILTNDSHTHVYVFVGSI